jgi:Insertion element 4 transposase N-terminal/Transposase DDE domain
MTHPWIGRTGVVNLGVLTQWVPPQVVARATAGRSRCRGRRPGALPVQFTAYFELALALFSQDSYEDVVDHLVGAIPELAGHAPAKSSLVAARRRLGPAAMRALFEQVAAYPVAGEGTWGARWRGFRTLGVDGFLLETPDTAANREYFGAPSNGSRRPIGYPQARVVTLVETGTRAPIAAAIGTYHTGEPTLAKGLASAVGPGDLVLFDRYYPSVTLWQVFDARGAALVMRADSRIARANTRPLGDGTYLAEMWVSGHPGRKGAAHVTMRVVEYRVDGGDEIIRLLTNLVDTDAYPPAAIAALYAERWQHECAIGQLKTHQHPRGGVLRSKDAALVQQEIWAMLTVNHILTRLITRIADERGQDPERISFTKVLKDARRTVIRQSARTLAIAAHRALDMADDLRRYLNPQRPDPRTSPRTLKCLRQRYKLRPATTRGTPVTTKTPPKTLTLHPIIQT